MKEKQSIACEQLYVFLFTDQGFGGNWQNMTEKRDYVIIQNK